MFSTLIADRGAELRPCGFHMPGPQGLIDYRRSKTVDVDDGLGKGLRSLLG
jgi:hypothetical protein